MVRTTGDSGEVTKFLIDSYDEELAALERAARAIDGR
jgi:hypothetical protein